MCFDVRMAKEPSGTAGSAAGLAEPGFVLARELLVSSGVRVTRQRVAVLGVIEAGEHLDAETIATRVRRVLGSISRQAVYDALAALTRAGVLRTIEPAGSPVLHERRRDRHHHLICRACRRVLDVDARPGTDVPLPVPDAHGFRVDGAEVTWWGLCPQCLLTETASAEPASP